MSKQILFNNATDVPDGDDTLTNPADVPEATIALFDADDFSRGTFDLDISNNGEFGHGIEKGVFVQGGETEDEAIFSPVFNFDEIKQAQINEEDFVDYTNQVTEVTAETGEGFATVRVVQVNTGFKPHKRITAEVELDDKTATEIAEELVGLINGADEDFVTASNTAEVLELTGDDEVSFETSTDGEASGWDVTLDTTPNFGNGTPSHVANLEEIAYGGNFTNRIYLPVNPPSYAEDENYDLFTILIPTNTTANIAKSNKYHQLILAVHNPATGIDLDELFFGDQDTDPDA